MTTNFNFNRTLEGFDLTLLDVDEEYEIDVDDYIIEAKFHGNIKDFIDKDFIPEGLFANYEEDKLIIFKNEVPHESLRVVKDETRKVKKVASNIINISGADDEQNTSSTTRTNAEDIIYLEVKAKDDKMTKLIKKELNKSKLRLSDITNKNSYNIFYGLKQRNSMSYITFEKWAKILKKDIKIELV